MNNVLLEWKGLGYLSIFQAQVYLYDDDNNLLYVSETYDGKLKVCLESNRVYKIIAISSSEIFKKNVYIDTCRNKYTFYFSRSIYPRIITFQLTDFYYKNLPIEKGEIIIWPKL